MNFFSKLHYFCLISARVIVLLLKDNKYNDTNYKNRCGTYECEKVNFFQFAYHIDRNFNIIFTTYKDLLIERFIKINNLILFI